MWVSSTLRLIDQHVYSDGFGGCELHVLAETNGMQRVGFLHVYRGQSSKVTYVVNPGWDVKDIIPTKGKVVQNMGIDIIAYAYIQGGKKIIQCSVLSLDNTGTVVGVERMADINL